MASSVWREPGTYSEVWDRRCDDRSVPSSGVYFYTLRASDFVATHRMVLVSRGQERR